MDNCKWRDSTFRIYRLQISKVTILRNLRYLQGKIFMHIKILVIFFSNVYTNLILGKMRDRNRQKCYVLRIFPNLSLILKVLLVWLAKSLIFYLFTRHAHHSNITFHCMVCRRDLCAKKNLSQSDEGKQKLPFNFDSMYQVR